VEVSARSQPTLRYDTRGGMLRSLSLYFSFSLPLVVYVLFY
jgi:hypothetical protein